MKKETQHYCDSCQEFYSAKHECKFECKNCKAPVNPQVKHECGIDNSHEIMADCDRIGYPPSRPNISEEITNRFGRAIKKLGDK